MLQENYGINTQNILGNYRIDLVAMMIGLHPISPGSIPGCDIFLY